MKSDGRNARHRREGSSDARWGIAVVAATLLGVGCSLDGVSLDGRSCPCVGGYRCDEARDVCVPIGDAGELDATVPDATIGDGLDAGTDAGTDGGAAPDAGVMDGGAGADGATVDGAVVDGSGSADAGAVNADCRGARAVRHVAPGGDDASTGEDAATPVRSLRRALELAMPGECVLLAPGRYAEDVTTVRGGTAAAPVRVEGPREAIVTGNGAQAVFTVRHAHVSLAGFSIDGLTGAADAVASYRKRLLEVTGASGAPLAGIVIDGLAVSNARETCVRLRVNVTGALVRANEISGCGVEDFRFGGTGKTGEGILVGTAPDDLAAGAHDLSRENRIEGNSFRDVSDCVELREEADATVLVGNRCERALDVDSGGFNVRSNDNVIEDNVLLDGLGAGVRFGGASGNGVRNAARRNTVERNAIGGFKIMSSPQGEICDNLLADNPPGDSVGSFAADYTPGAPCP